MNRCPECEFLYEDDQRHCDMDGTALVHDAFAFPDGTPVLAGQVSRHDWQRVAVAFPLTILAVLAFYVRQHQPLPSSGHAGTATTLTATQDSSANSADQGVTPSSAPAGNSSGQASEAGGAPNDSSNAHASGSNGTNDARDGQAAAPQNSDPGLNAVSSEAPRGSETSNGSDSNGSSAKPAVRTSSAKRAPRASYSESPKKDSKIGSFLKKTGRILSKPFKR